MLHEALMLEIYRQALNAGALPTARPRSTESANSSERCPSHDSNSSENGRENNGSGNNSGNATGNALSNHLNATFPAGPQTLPAQPPSMEAYLQMVAAAAQQYGFPLGAAAAAAGGHRLPLLLPTTDPAAPFKLPLQASPTASSNNSEALDFRTNLFERSQKAEPPASEDDDEEDDSNDINNPLDLSVGTRKRSADMENEPDSSIGQIQVKKIYKSDSPPLHRSENTTAQTAAAAVPPNAAPLLQNVNPYLAAVAAANIFRAGQFPDWNGKNDLVVDPLEKMSDIVKGPRKEKQSRSTTAAAVPVPPQVPTSQPNSTSTTLPASNEGITKARHNIWQSHWQNKGVASSVFRCVWCKQSFSTLEALTAHMKDSKHCGVNVPPFGNLPNTDRHHQPPPPQQQQSNAQHNSHNLRKQHNNSGANSGPSAAAKAAFQYRGDPPTPLPRKLVRGQNVWLGKGVEQAMQILKCMRCGESFRSLGEMTKHMQETQHYTNILSQDQTISMKNSSAASSGENKEGQNSLSSEESRTLSAVLTCKVCDKAFNSLGDLSNHMAKNNHYAEPLMQSMTGTGGVGNRKRPAPKKREKSLPVRKLLEMKGAQNEAMDSMEAKMQRNFDNNKRMSMDGTGIGPGAGEKSDAALFAERMRQYISGVKADEAAKAGLGPNNFMAKSKSPDVEPKNGTTKSNAGTSSVLSAIEHMFTTSFDTPPPRQASLPATSPSNSSTKNTSPVASSILKRLGIDENVDYNKPLIDTTDPYYQHYRYTSSERSGSECSAEIHVEPRKMTAPTPEKMHVEADLKTETKVDIKRENDAEQAEAMETETTSRTTSERPAHNVEIKTEEPKSPLQSGQNSPEATNGTVEPATAINNNNNDYNKERSVTPPKSSASSPLERTLAPRSPTGSHRSVTPKSPASSIKSYDGDKKYPSDSLNALSSMFDSLGSTGTATGPATRSQLSGLKMESPENLSTTNSLAALRQFCVKKEKTA